MIINCMGRVNVSVSGTPVPLTTNPAITASKLFVQVIPGLTGQDLFRLSHDGESHARGCRPHPVAEHQRRASRKTFSGVAGRQEQHPADRLRDRC